MSFFVVVYTTAHLIGAVSTPLDLDQCAATTDHWTERSAYSGDNYTFVCEEHAKPPKLQVKIPADDRKFFSGYCTGNQLGCTDLPNGDIELYAHGLHCSSVIAKKDRANPNAKPIKSTCPWDRK